MPSCNQDSVIVIMWTLLVHVMKCKSASLLFRLLALIRVQLLSELMIFVAIVVIGLKLLNSAEPPTESAG